MPAHFLLHAAISLAPVLVFLALLLSFDSYKLVSFRETTETLLGGLALCGVSYVFNAGLIAITRLDFLTYSHFVAPFLEEAAKGAMMVWLIGRNRIGFAIDAAIMGFAVGTGFSVVENLYYLSVFPDVNVPTLVVRGFGTALMHGGATALFGVVTQAFIDRDRFDWTDFLPGYGAAVLLHAAYNLLYGTPLIAALSLLLALPVLLYFVFSKSEHKVHDWLVQDYETHELLLIDIQTGAFTHAEAGRFITTMASKLGPQVASDMFVYIRVHTELALRADQVDLARETENPVPITDADRANFAKLHELERKIGRASMLMLRPHLHFTRKQLWELNEFEQEVREVD